VEDKELQKLNKRLCDENEKLKVALKRTSDKKQISVLDYFPKTSKGIHVRHGLVSDTHMGNIYANKHLLHTLYDIFEKEGIETVYHCGDICDGDRMYRGQEYELYAHGVDEQTRDVIKNYPKRKGIKTLFITGNHDLSFYKRSGIDIGNIIAEKRPDMEYVGRETANILMGNKEKKIRVKLMHPGKGTAYAISYHPQKITESFSGGNKPNVLYIGHYHKAEMLPCQRNVHVIQAGTTQRQTDFMQRNFLAAHQGGWIVDAYIDKNYSVGRFQGEFFPFYEKKGYRGRA